MTAARAAVAERLGDAAVADSAAIVATFQKMTRVADSTGIPLDAVTEMASRDLRDQLGVNEFASARNTPAPALLQQLGAKVLGPLMPHAMKLMSKLPKRLVDKLYRL